MIYCTVHVVFSFWLTRNMRNMANDKQVFLVYSNTVLMLDMLFHLYPIVVPLYIMILTFPTSPHVGIWCKICSKQFSPSYG